MPQDHLIVLNTCPDQATGEKIAGVLVTEGLAACVNIVPGITSVYQWKGQLEKGTEVLLLIKTRTEQYPQLEKQITEIHPYELPEIISVSIQSGLAAYLNWIDSITGKKE